MCNGIKVVYALCIIGNDTPDVVWAETLVQRASQN